MEKSYIEIDAGPWLTCDGDIEVSVYLGDGCEPNHTSKVSLKELVDRELESMIKAPAKKKAAKKKAIAKIAEYHKEDVNLLLASLKEAYEYACKRAKELE